MPFELDMEVRSSVIARQHIRERRDADPREGLAKPGTSVKRLEGDKCLVGDRTGTVCRAVYGVVMDHDEVVVAAQVYVEFQMASSHLERQVKGCYGVLRGIGRRASMGNDKEALLRQLLCS